MAAHLRVIEPRNENRSVPTRPANAELRSREYLTPAEVAVPPSAVMNFRLAMLIAIGPFRA